MKSREQLEEELQILLMSLSVLINKANQAITIKHEDVEKLAGKFLSYEIDMNFRNVTFTLNSLSEETLQ